MSRTRESTNVQSPVQAHIFYNGNKGSFGRAVEGDNEMQEIPLPLKFVVLDDKGFRVSGETRGTTKRKIKSNLCHLDFNRLLKVTYSDNGEVIAEGEWNQVGEKVKNVGGKYTAILYVMLSLNGEQLLGAIHLRGRAVAEWFKFAKGRNVTGDFFYSVQKVEKTVGNDIDSYVPVFAEHALPAEMGVKAGQMDEALQAWLEQYFFSDIPAATNSRSAGPSVEPEPPARNADPFNVPVGPQYAQAAAPAGDDDLPF